MFFSKGSDAEAAPPLPGRIIMPMSEVLPESNVLRKVASLTLDRAIIDQKVVRPKNVPQKLEYQIYEKFEGRKCGIVYSNWILLDILCVRLFVRTDARAT